MRVHGDKVLRRRDGVGRLEDYKNAKEYCWMIFITCVAIVEKIVVLCMKDFI